MVVALVIGLAGCDQRGGSPESKHLTVFAASSLTDAFTDIEQGFERTHPGIDVGINFAGSQALRLQIEQGAEADVFASANPSHMKALVDAGLIAGSQTFAGNELIIIAPRSNPAAIESVGDLGRADRLVIGAGAVPVGAYTQTFFDKARTRLGVSFIRRVRDSIVSKESNVRLVLSKVELGEADAAVVYRSEAVSSDQVEVVAIPDSLNVDARYPIGRLTDASAPHLADTFIDYVRSRPGRRRLDRRGFVVDSR